MALQISPSHWAHLCCLDCRRTSSFPEETHLRMQRRARRVHTSWHNIYAARMHTHARRRALARSLFTSSLKCFVCLVTDWCVYFWCCGERKTRQNGRRRGTGEASRHTHTHTHTHTCCLLPAQATKWGVPFSLIMAAVWVTWATHSRAVGAPGALTDPEQRCTGTNYIALICLFQHLLIKSHSLSLDGAFPWLIYTSTHARVCQIQNNARTDVLLWWMT